MRFLQQFLTAGQERRLLALAAEVQGFAVQRGIGHGEAARDILAQRALFGAIDAMDPATRNATMEDVRAQDWHFAEAALRQGGVDDHGLDLLRETFKQLGIEQTLSLVSAGYEAHAFNETIGGAIDRFGEDRDTTLARVMQDPAVQAEAAKLVGWRPGDKVSPIEKVVYLANATDELQRVPYEKRMTQAEAVEFLAERAGVSAVKMRGMVDLVRSRAAEHDLQRRLSHRDLAADRFEQSRRAEAEEQRQESRRRRGEPVQDENGGARRDLEAAAEKVAPKYRRTRGFDAIADQERIAKRVEQARDEAGRFARSSLREDLEAAASRSSEAPTEHSSGESEAKSEAPSDLRETISQTYDAVEARG